MPGGCAIGQRPIDLHLKGMAALGAGSDDAAGLYRTARDASRRRRLSGFAKRRCDGKHYDGRNACRRASRALKTQPRNRKSSIWRTVSTRWARWCTGRARPPSSCAASNLSTAQPISPSLTGLRPARSAAQPQPQAGNILLRNARPEQMRALLFKLQESGTTVSEFPGGAAHPRQSQMAHGDPDVKLSRFPYRYAGAHVGCRLRYAPAHPCSWRRFLKTASCTCRN